MSFLVFTRDKARYAVPGGILSTSNHTTTFPKVWPCALQIVMEYARLIG